MPPPLPPAVLLVMWLLLNVSEFVQKGAAPVAIPPPSPLAVLPLTVLSSSASAPQGLEMPPPLPPLVAWLSATVLLFSVSVPPLSIAPTKAGEVLPLTALLSSPSVPLLDTPPLVPPVIVMPVIVTDCPESMETSGGPEPPTVLTTV